MKHKIGLRIKTTVLFLGFILLITAAVLLITNHNNDEAIDDIYRQYAVDIGELAASKVTVEEIQQYMDSGQTNKRYEEIMQELEKIQDTMTIQYLYIIYPISEQEGVYIFDVDVMENGEIQTKGNPLGKRIDLLEEGFGGAIDVIRNQTASAELEFDGDRSYDTTANNDGEEAEENLASVYVPIQQDEGTMIAFVGVDIDLATIQNSIEKGRNHLVGALLLLMAVCFVIVMITIQYVVLRPIHNLKRYAERISSGDFGETLTVRGHDELSEISEVFNRMAYSIQGHMEEVEGINQAYQKYVPLELLHILNRDKITQLELGHRASRFVTILTFQLTETKRKMMNQDSRQVLEDMNLLFQTIIPIITEGNGFVERFQDAGMLAVYTGGPEDALLSAISICQRMRRYRNGEEPSRLSIGITYGGVLFGTVGHEKRMAAIAISPYTSMAWHLQKLAPLYGSQLLIASGAAEQIKGFPHSYHCRFIGMTENKYTRNVEKVYDIYDGDSEEQRIGKERTKEFFEQGVELFCLRRFRESRRAFIEVLKRFHTDAGAKRYLQYCNQYYTLEQVEDIAIFMQL